MPVQQYNLIIAQESEQPAVRQIEETLEQYKLKNDHTQSQPLPKLVMPEGDEVELPSFMVQLLREIAYESALGNAVRIVSLSKEVSLYEAAEFLNVPLSQVAGLLDSGELPSVQGENERLIPIKALIAHKKHKHKQNGKERDTGSTAPEKSPEALQKEQDQISHLPLESQALIRLLRSWRESDDQERIDTWEYLKQALDEDCFSERELFV
jgi:hypothetical protein